MQKGTDTELSELLNDYLSDDPDKEGQLADELFVSIFTIRRWSKGKNTPQTSVAHSVIAHLKQARINEINKRVQEFHKHRNDPYAYDVEEIDEVRAFYNHALKDIAFLLTLVTRQPKS